MDERTLIFQKVQKGEMIFTLEKDRRSGYPIFDTARIVKVGESKPILHSRDSVTENCSGAGIG